MLIRLLNAQMMTTLVCKFCVEVPSGCWENRKRC